MRKRSLSLGFASMFVVCCAVTVAAQGPGGAPAAALSLVDANGNTIAPVVSVAIVAPDLSTRPHEQAILRIAINADDDVFIRANDRGFTGQFDDIFFDEVGCAGRAFVNPGLFGVKPHIALLNGTSTSPSLWVTKLPRGITTAFIQSYRARTTGVCQDVAFGEFELEEMVFVRDLTGFTPPFRLVP